MLGAAPLAGLPIALLAAAVFALAHGAGLSALIGATLALASSILATGALHEDGLADMVDGFGGGRTIERKLEIMKDSALGTYGLLALLVSFALRVTALAALASPLPVLFALVAAHMSSRALLAAFMKSLPGARENGLAAGMGDVPRIYVFIALFWGITALGGVGLVSASPLFLVFCLLALGLWFMFLRALVRKQIGGYTGDVLGALQQGGEVLVLLVASVLLV